MMALTQESHPDLDRHIAKMADLPVDYFWHDHRYQMVLRQLMKTVSALGTPKKLKILDYGCGSGYLLGRLARETSGLFDLSGFDPSPESGASLRGADGVLLGHDTSMIPRSLDIITLMDVLEHVDDDVGLLRHLSSKIAADGTIIVTVPAFQSLWSAWDEQLGHRRRYSICRINSMAKLAGLKVRTVTFLFPWLIPSAVTRHFKANAGSGTEFPVLSPLVNRALRVFNGLERAVSRIFPIPFGTSIFVVLTKK